MRRLLALAAVAVTTCFGSTAAADEAWSAPEVGTIIWESDVGETSVFTYETPSGRTVRLYVEGLNANIENRRSMSGYWIMEGDGQGEGLCGAMLTAPDGHVSSSWGRMTMRWQRRTFPSGWTAQLSDCFAGPTTSLRARPLVGG
jgi:hypothetical protein